MTTTYDKLDTINDSLNDIKTAIIGKGQTPSGNITTYATAIDNIVQSSPVIDSLSITPTTSAQTITAPSGTDGYSPITVSAVTAAIDNNIVASNIVSGVSILGVSGSATVLNGETRSVSITSTAGNTFTPTSGKNAITSITVTPTNEARTVNPSTSSQSLTVNSGYSGNGTITVNPVTASIDANIIAENIKKDVTILGVTGSLESGGGGDVDHGGEYSVKVIDYDGSIITEDHLDTGDTFTLPAAPSHTGLTFQEWSGTTTITNNTVTVGTEDILIGAVYETTSGLCEFDIEISENTGLEINCHYIFDTGSMYSTAQVDWGDGSPIEIKPTYTAHTYPTYGTYTIKTNLRFDDSFYMDNQRPLILPADSSVKYASINIIKAIRFSTAATTSSNINLGYNFTGELLEYVIIPRGLTNCQIDLYDSYTKIKSLILPTTFQSVNNRIFINSRSFKYLIMPNNAYNAVTSFQLYNTFEFENFKIPNSITSLPSSGNYHNNNYNLEKVIIPSSITTIPQQVFRYNYRLKYVIVLGNVTSIERYAFYESGNLRIIDFTHCSSVPTLSNTNAFPTKLYNYYYTDCKILVPSRLLYSWKTATNWSTFAKIIYGV